MLVLVKIQQLVELNEQRLNRYQYYELAIQDLLRPWLHLRQLDYSYDEQREQAIAWYVFDPFIILYFNKENNIIGYPRKFIF